MNQLPKVLQNEIWEYVRGDRAHWMRQFFRVVWDIRSPTKERLKRVKFVKEHVDVRITQWDNDPIFRVIVHTTDESWIWIRRSRHGNYFFGSLTEAECAMNDAVYLARLGKFDDGILWNLSFLDECPELSWWSRYVKSWMSWLNPFTNRRH